LRSRDSRRIQIEENKRWMREAGKGEGQKSEFKVEKRTKV